MNRFLLGAALLSICSSEVQAQSVVIVNGQKVLVPPKSAAKQPQPGYVPPNPTTPHSSFLVNGSDDCANAAANDAITGLGTFTVSAGTGTATTSTQQATCGGGADLDVWFAWTSTVTGTVIVATCGGTSVDTVLAVWNGSACPTIANLVGCNDDFCGLQSQVTFTATSGNVYLIQIGSFSNTQPAWNGSFTISTPPPPTGNDDCSLPVAISGAGTFPVNTTGATDSTQQSGTCPTAHKDVWMVWTATQTGNARVRMCSGTTADTVIAAYSGSACPTSGLLLACNDDSCGLQSSILFPVTNGNAYMLQFGAFGTTTTYTGTFDIDFPAPPANDDCSTPTNVVGSGPFPFDDTFATTGTQGQGEAACNFTGGTAVARDVWFTWTATFTSTAAQVTTCSGTTVNTKIAVYNGAGCPGGPAIGCNDDSCGVQAAASFPSTQGQTYTIQLGLNATGTNGGTGSFRIIDAMPPANDDCSTPTVITGPGPFSFDSTYATTGTEGQTEALCNSYNQPSIVNDQWYAWTPSMTGTATFTDCGMVMGGGDTKVAIYDGIGCPTPGSAVACNDDEGYPGTLTCTAGIFNSTATWNTVCGHTYLIQLGRYVSATASFGTFTITETGTSCNSGTGYCFGDGTSTACPCTPGTAGNGCPNSVNANGANLDGTGVASVSADTLVLHGSGMPNSTCLYFQGTTQISIVFGDGLRCAGGQVIRLGIKINSGGASQYPDTGDQSVSMRGFVPAGGGSRTYQAWYRNAAAYCTAATFNLSNGLLVNWLP